MPEEAWLALYHGKLLLTAKAGPRRERERTAPLVSREGSLTHAFISYVRENSETVVRLASELRSRGIEVWLDRDSIYPRLRWKDAINKAIQEGAFFIACFSNELNKRQQPCKYGEISLAVDRLRQMPRDREWFIPVVLDDTRASRAPWRACSRPFKRNAGIGIREQLTKQCVVRWIVG